MSAPDHRAAQEMATARLAKARRPGGMKARIAWATAEEERQTGKRMPEHLSDDEYLRRLLRHLERAGYVGKELPRRRAVHWFRFAK